mmetsp:Transcript_20366/g.37850  ORF Transcript_20366/g.37850 Transcript_20366/m.37850 type:complete len:450 (-) Transcript_20366:173-1522(-)
MDVVQHAREGEGELARAVAVVDAFSTGELLANSIKARGFKLVLIYSQPKQEEGVFSNSIKDADAEVYHSDLPGTVSALKQLNGLDLFCILPGAESGVILADLLMEELQLDGRNPLDLSEARRSKWLQQETIRKAGVRAAKQILATEWDEVEDFILEWQPDPFKVIVKPNQSAGSDDVFLCTDLAETKAAFDCINGAINLCGETNKGVLVMEFLEGKEYVVDSVSLNGVHKVIAIWKYDKRKANGQFNVYFGMEVCSVASDLELELVQYSEAVLNALEINNGPSHMEIIVTPSGPCLVEVGARCHGGHGTWAVISSAAFGYNQIESTIDAFTNPERFEALPPFPTDPEMFGKEVFLVSYREGIVRDIPGAEKVKSLASYNAIDMGVKDGSTLRKTIDLFTMPGRCQLLHESQEQVEEDYNFIHGMLHEGEMFELVTGKALEAIPDGPAEE